MPRRSRKELPPDEAAARMQDVLDRARDKCRKVSDMCLQVVRREEVEDQEEAPPDDAV